MQATVLAFGARGDVQPLLALASGLRAAGHRVRFTTETVFQKAAISAGFEYYEIPGESEKFFAGISGVAFRDSFERSPAYFEAFWRTCMVPNLREILRDVVAPCEGSDFLVCLPYMTLGPSLSEKFGVPCFSAGVIPVPAFPTRHFRYPFLNELSQTLTPEQNLTSWQRAEPFVRAVYGLIQDWRRETLNLPFQTFDEYNAQCRSTPHLFGWSPALVPRPSDWESQWSVTGFWLLNQTSDYSPPHELQDFLNAGEPPLLIGFSSNVASNPERLTRTVTGALDMCGKRGILISGWGGLKNSGLPSFVFGISNVPHQWLLPRVSAAVHHGGCGTVGVCVHTGTPQVIVAFGYDQTFWGERVAKAGLGPWPLMAKTVTTEQLADSIRRATEDKQIAMRAAEVSAMVADEDGVGNAVREIEQMLAAEVCESRDNGPFTVKRKSLSGSAGCNRNSH